MPNHAQREVEAMLSAHRPFSEIEHYIEGLGLADEFKSALWLFAWVEVDRADRRQAVGELIAGAAHTL